MWVKVRSYVEQKMSVQQRRSVTEAERGIAEKCDLQAKFSTAQPEEGS